MTVNTNTTVATRPSAPHPKNVGFTNILMSEWTKLRSVRSTYWTLVSATVFAIALAIGLCARYVHDYDHLAPDYRHNDVTNFSLNGIYLAQVAVGTLGVLVISSEYSTGMIRTTLTAVPRRRLVLAAKGTVLGATATAVGEIISFIAFGCGQAILSHKHLGVSLHDPGVFRATMGAGLYLAATALLGLGLGALIRHTAGALSAFFGLMYASSIVTDLLPTNWRNHVINYMPANAGSQIMSVLHTDGALSAWAGFAVFIGYVAVFITTAAMLIDRNTE